MFHFYLNFSQALNILPQLFSGTNCPFCRSIKNSIQNAMLSFKFLHFTCPGKETSNARRICVFKWLFGLILFFHMFSLKGMLPIFHANGKSRTVKRVSSKLRRRNPRVWEGELLFHIFICIVHFVASIRLEENSYFSYFIHPLFPQSMAGNNDVWIEWNHPRFSSQRKIFWKILFDQKTLRMDPTENALN